MHAKRFAVLLNSINIDFTTNVRVTFDASGHSSGTFDIFFTIFGTGSGEWAGTLTSGSAVTQ